MRRHRRCGVKKNRWFVLALFLAGMMTACKKELPAQLLEAGAAGSSANEEETLSLKGAGGEEEPVSDPEALLPADEAAAQPGNGGEKVAQITGAPATGAREPDAAQDERADSLKKRFGESCIAEQTFETELSEYDGPVFFVPLAPSDENPEFTVRLMQGEEILAEIPPFVPDSLSGQAFKSLDAVSFYDVNYDGNTDVVWIATYGTAGAASVYYGYGRDTEDSAPYFVAQEALSAQISSQVTPLTVPEIRRSLSGGKKNGQFASYQEAYRAVSRLCDLEDTEGMMMYDLIDFDGDDIPELVAGVNGFYTSLYTYSGGTVYTVMDGWRYGVMGNAGYEYQPGKNRLRNYNNDYAGAIVYATYMEMDDSHTMKTVAEIKTVNFDDANQNGMPDEDEMNSIGCYGISYINGREAAPEECAALDAGEYVFIQGTKRFEELKDALR